MAENKTKPTAIDAADFLDAVEQQQKRDDAWALCTMMARLSGEPPLMWGPSIVGFGSCHYRYESGREGDMPRIGFSPRKDALVLYLTDSFPHYQALMDRFGKHKTGKSCLYVKKLADVDMAVLEELIVASLAHVDEKYPAEA